MLSIGYQIYLRRLEQEWTQADFAKRTGIPQPNLSNIEKGKQDITVSTLRRIAVALNVHPREFFDDFGEESVTAGLSRAKIENIAKLIADEKKPLNSEEREIASLFKKVIPYKGRVRVRELHQAWLELRKRFNPLEINNVYERVEEHKRRK